MDLLLLLGRVLFGGFFLYNAFNHFTKANMMTAYTASKHVPSPKLAVYATGLLLFLGGTGVLLGISPEWALLCLLVFLVPVTFIMHQFWRETDPMQRMVQTIQFTKNVALIGAVLMMLSLSTPWPISF
ncbi:MAG: DoxX family membrane protein [Candidatus Pacebacteria bacterium]|nr:DoxX family membrane protein [Candidatus Paceibacterota bacterium]